MYNWEPLGPATKYPGGPNGPTKSFARGHEVERHQRIRQRPGQEKQERKASIQREGDQKDMDREQEERDGNGKEWKGTDQERQEWEREG